MEFENSHGTKYHINWTRDEWKKMYGLMRGMVKGIPEPMLEEWRWSDDPYQILTYKVLYHEQRYINVYTANRAYGGPEEGGWWYDYGRIRLTKKINLGITQDHAMRLWERLRNALEGKERYGKSSVLCSGVTEIGIDPKPGENYPAERPYYE